MIRDRDDGGDLRLAEVATEEPVELVDFDLPEEEIESLMERGMLPGCRMCTVRHSPFGDPVVLVDGTMIALRKELARCLCVRRCARRAGAASG